MRRHYGARISEAETARTAFSLKKQSLGFSLSSVFYFFYFFFGIVFMIASMAMSVISTLKRSATIAANRISVLSVRPTKIFCRRTKPLPFSPVKIAAERATPKAAPKEEAIL